MARKKNQLDTDQRPFVMAYHDFLKSGLLDNHYQIVVFIYLKMFADDNNQCYPSIKKLSKLSKISVHKIKITLAELESKGIIAKKNRTRLDGGKSSNLYTLYDYKELWNTDSGEEITTIIDEIKEKHMIEALTAKGYHITKEKELETEPTKAQNQAPQLNNMYVNKDNTKQSKSQELERYTIDQIHQLFDYDVMIQENPYRQQDIDSVMNILYTTMNTTKATIRIAGEDNPSMIVIGKLMKLDKESIMYALDKFAEQTERIKNPTSYLLTILYFAPEQFHLDIQNQVSHDMAHWNQEE